MEKQGAKKRRREEDGSTDMDRISELPQPILHHILCYLPQNDVVRTCVLSKSWRDLGITRPKIEFRHLGRDRIPKNKEEFPLVVHRTLHRYQDRKLPIQEFVLVMNPNNPQLVRIFDEWILLVLHRGVKIFNFNFGNRFSYFSLPSVIFQAESIEELYLAECRGLNPIDKVLLKNLRTLSLVSIGIEEETLNKILSSCPLIEKLVLRWCKQLKTIKLNDVRNLKHFEGHVADYDETTRIEFNSQTLETIHIVHYGKWNHHKCMCFPHLKSLFLQKVQLSTKSVDIFSSNFPCLVELKLVFCKGFKEFQLSSPSIKRLTINGCTKSIQYIIDAPNILYFEFSENSPPSSFSFTTTSNEWKSRIHLSCPLDSEKDAFSTWFLNVNELFKALSKSQLSLDLYCDCCLSKRISEDTYCDSYEPVEVEHLIASEGLLSTYLPRSLNLVFRTCRPRYIIDFDFFVDVEYEFQREHNRKVERLCKILHKEREAISQLCFWKHDLKEVIVKTFDESEKEWRLVHGTCLSEYSLPNKQPKQKIHIRLKWRES